MANWTKDCVGPPKPAVPTCLQKDTICQAAASINYIMNNMHKNGKKGSPLPWRPSQKGFTVIEVVIEEDDGFWDDYLTTVTVGVGPNVTTGQATFTLDCKGGVVGCGQNRDDDPSPAQIQAEAKRMMWALRSEQTQPVQCVAETPDE